MEAALRTAYEVATGKKLTKIEFDQIRGTDGIKTGTMIVNGTEIKFAVASGGANIMKLLKDKDRSVGNMQSIFGLQATFEVTEIEAVCQRTLRPFQTTLPIK